MIINVFSNFVLQIVKFMTSIVMVVALPDSIIQTINDFIDLLFENFTIINMLCHLSYLKTIIFVISAIIAFRMSINLLRFITSRGHT